MHISGAAWAQLGFVIAMIGLTVFTYFQAVRNPSKRKFAIDAANSLVVGLLLGAAAIFGVTLMIQRDTKPPLPAGDSTSILNRVEYGNRS
jgi:hypothetical protein